MDIRKHAYFLSTNILIAALTLNTSYHSSIHIAVDKKNQCSVCILMVFFSSSSVLILSFYCIFFPIDFLFSSFVSLVPTQFGSFTLIMYRIIDNIGIVCIDKHRSYMTINHLSRIRAHIHFPLIQMSQCKRIYFIYLIHIFRLFVQHFFFSSCRI